jgi:hypothetical protein
MQPMVAAQGLQDLTEWHGAVLHGNAGVLGLRTFLVDRVAHQAGQKRGIGTAVVDRGDRGAAAAIPPGAGTGHCLRVVAPGENPLPHARRAQAGVHIDPGNLTRGLCVVSQHLAQCEVAPAGCGATKKQAIGEGMLPLRNSGLKPRLTMLDNIGLDGGHIGRIGRPAIGQQKVMQAGIGLVDRQRPGEVEEIPVDVDVFVGHAAQMRETMGVEPVHIEHRHAGLARVLAPLGVVCRKHLHPRTAEALGAMAAAAQNQQSLGVGGAIQRHIHRQGLAILALQRVVVAANRHAGGCSRLQKLHARAGITG